MTNPHSEIRADVIVLGAGIVGVSTALHLQMRGRDVVLIDRRGAGEETSHGNAGLIERSSVIPYGFPRDLRTILLYALNLSADVRSDWRFLPRIAPLALAVLARIHTRIVEKGSGRHAASYRAVSRRA